ncbi:hypothetical protein HDK90DRAFT_467756 [Phyllosticta capitalensis]|uniref:Uncharacterized protein n=1 Tax=Phyllosticta capitalensis TaxID=121624 RepID=A0ABR1YJ83_9PEZI
MPQVSNVGGGGRPPRKPHNNRPHRGHYNERPRLNWKELCLRCGDSIHGEGHLTCRRKCHHCRTLNHIGFKCPEKGDNFYKRFAGRRAGEREEPAAAMAPPPTHEGTQHNNISERRPSPRGNSTHRHRHESWNNNQSEIRPEGRFTSHQIDSRRDFNRHGRSPSRVRRHDGRRGESTYDEIYGLLGRLDCGPSRRSDSMRGERTTDLILGRAVRTMMTEDEESLRDSRLRSSPRFRQEIWEIFVEQLLSTMHAMVERDEHSQGSFSPERHSEGHRSPSQHLRRQPSSASNGSNDPQSPARGDSLEEPIDLPPGYDNDSPPSYDDALADIEEYGVYHDHETVNGPSSEEDEDSFATSFYRGPPMAEWIQLPPGAVVIYPGAEPAPVNNGFTAQTDAELLAEVTATGVILPLEDDAELLAAADVTGVEIPLPPSPTGVEVPLPPHRRTRKLPATWRSRSI